MEGLLLSTIILGFGLAYYTHAIPIRSLQACGDLGDRLIFIIAVSTLLLVTAARILTEW